MCGICGVIALDGALDPRIGAALPAMTRALRHRGPDGEGLFSDSCAALGHRRLAIIDRAGGAQPLTNEDRTHWIVFNGEVYNHADLRRELTGRGHRFRTSSDTETILRAYEEYGTDCVDKLEGMFAFAIYDRRRRELFAARDRLGKKPFFFAVLGGALYFASELKALRLSPAWDDTLNLSTLEAYFSLGYIPAPHTIYRCVRKLEPAHCLLMSGRAVRVWQYWDVTRFDDESLAGADLDLAIEGALKRAVAERLESEVPLGAFLSGGIDSGLVVSLMTEATGASVRSTSVGFGEAAHNELEAARRSADYCGAAHHAHVVQPELESVMDAIVAAFDEPFADSSAIPTYYVSAMARRHVTVALSGDGGDETFGGYGSRYAPHAIEGLARRSMSPRASAWLAAAGARWPRHCRIPRALRLGNVLENIGRDAATAYYVDLCFLKPPAARALLGLSPLRDLADSPVHDLVTGPYRRCPSPNGVQRAEYADLKIYLPNDVLVKVDRMSMAHGLEVRCPLLDRRLVELAFRIPVAAKMPLLRPKHLLRRLARKRLPAAVARLPKHGFTAPVGRWIGGRYAEWFRSDVTGPDAAVSSLLDHQQVMTLFEQHRSGRRDHSFALWAIWMLERWCRSNRHTPAATNPLVLRSA